jgi:hypothetical protein
MIAALLLASFGLLLNVLGRWAIIHDSRKLSRWWRFALIALPFAEVVFVVQRGERTPRGSLVCALSFALMLPIVGQFAVILRDAGCSPVALLFDARARDLVLGEAQRVRRAKADTGRATLAARKEAKVRDLSDYLQRWHLLLTERRDSFCEEAGEEMLRFNEDAAAYHALLAASRIELAEWKALGKGRSPIAFAPAVQP